MKKNTTILATLVLVAICTAKPNENKLGPAKPENIAKVEAALPEKAPAQPSKPRKILVVSRCEGYVHQSIPLGVKAIELLGEKTGAYTIEETQEMEAFTAENLQRFDAILFLSTTRLDPTPEQRTALLSFVRDGKGIIGIHAATDNFYQWEEGAKMMGGRFCGHPWLSCCTVKVKLDEPDHPVNECFHGESFVVTDEIFQFKSPYSRQNQHVITSLDLSDPDTQAVKEGNPQSISRTDGDFAITWLRREGKGRVFYCSLGHNHHIFWDTRILQHYLAGIQYALGDYQVPTQTPLDAIRTLDPTSDQSTRRPIEAHIFASPKAKLPTLEKELLDIFQSSKTTLEGKQYACRMLRHCASETSIPVLAPKLADPELSQFVRRVFQGLETPKADKALIKALPKANPAIKIGIIGTLGQRGSEKSVKAIKPYLKNTDVQLQRTAIIALGNIGGKGAAKALIKAKVNPQLSNDWKRAQLECARTLKAKTAERAYRKFFAEEHADAIRADALAGLVSLDPAGASSEVFARLDSNNPLLKKSAITLLTKLPSMKLTGSLDEISKKNQMRIIIILSDRKATEAEVVMLGLAASTHNESTRNAALLALGSVGTSASIQPLLAEPATNAPAFNALCALNAEGADAAILLSLENASDEPTAIKRLECLALRQTHAALPAAVKVAEGPWNRRTKTAIDTVGALVRTEDFPTFAQLMLSATETKKLQALEKSAAKASLRQTEIDLCAEPLVKAFGNAKPESQYALLRTLGRMGGEVAREQLTQSLGNPDPSIKDAAIRGLCNWPNLEVADQLLEQVKTAEIEKHRILALRGYIRLAGTTHDFAVVSNMCHQAAATAEQPAELKGIIGCMKRFRKQEVLDFLAPYLDHPDVFDEAAWGICEISSHPALRQPSLPLLEKIAALATEERLLAEVDKKIKEYQPKPET